MPSEAASVLGENTRFRPGYCAHQARSTASPNAVSAAASGRGSTAGSMVATPRATGTGCAGRGAGALAQPAEVTATQAAASNPREVLTPYRMPLGRRAARTGSVTG